MIIPQNHQFTVGDVYFQAKNFRPSGLQQTR